MDWCELPVPDLRTCTVTYVHVGVPTPLTQDPTLDARAVT